MAGIQQRDKKMYYEIWVRGTLRGDFWRTCVDVMGNAFVIYRTLDQNASRSNIKYMSFLCSCTR